ncbi:MAG: hypothetical protein U0163_14830 [Gemmatimonadaceae bacterium]
MSPSKQQAMMFLLGAVLVGGALGFTADRVMIQDRICANDNAVKDARAAMAERLHLTKAQEVRVDSLLDERHRQYEVVIAPVRDKMDSVKAHSRAQIRRLLDSSQAVEFDAFIRELSDTTKRRDHED